MNRDKKREKELLQERWELAGKALEQGTPLDDEQVLRVFQIGKALERLRRGENES